MAVITVGADLQTAAVRPLDLPTLFQLVQMRHNLKNCSVPDSVQRNRILVKPDARDRNIMVERPGICIGGTDTRKQRTRISARPAN